MNGRLVCVNLPQRWSLVNEDPKPRISSQHRSQYLLLILYNITEQGIDAMVVLIYFQQTTGRSVAKQESNKSSTS